MRYNIGDEVVIKESFRNCFKKGEIVEISELYSPIMYWATNKIDRQTIQDCDIAHKKTAKLHLVGKYAKRGKEISRINEVRKNEIQIGTCWFSLEEVKRDFKLLIETDFR